MCFKQLTVFVLTAVLVTSCAFYPKVSDKQPYSKKCSMQTKQLALSVKAIKGNLCGSTSDVEACLMTFGVIVPAGSFVISGGIVLAGNTLHWLEYQGSCEDSFIIKSINELNGIFKTTSIIEQTAG